MKRPTQCALRARVGTRDLGFGSWDSTLLKPQSLHGIEPRCLARRIDRRQEADEDGRDDDNGEIERLVEEIGRPGCTKHTLLIDTEPNNVSADSQKLGKIQPGTCYTVRGDILINMAGTIDGPGEFDFDGFRLQVQVDQLIVASLTHSEDNDYDLGYYDVLNQNFVETCEESITPEVCELTVSGLAAPAPVDLVILPFEGIGNYTLEVMAIP